MKRFDELELMRVASDGFGPSQARELEQLDFFRSRANAIKITETLCQRCTRVLSG